MDEENTDRWTEGRNNRRIIREEDKNRKNMKPTK